MSQRQRVLLSMATVVVIVAAFVVLRPDDGQDSVQPAQTSAPAPATATTPAVTDTREPPPPVPEAAPRPRFVQIRAQGLQPVGGVKKIDVNKGDTVRFEVRSDQADEGHLHGYDISKPVGPGKTARYEFTARIEGIFELELEGAGVAIGELQVNP